MLAKDEYKCVILDLNLPDRSGYELLEAVKQNNVKKAAIIIYTSASLTEGDERRMREYADAIVIKNVHANDRLMHQLKLALNEGINRNMLPLPPPINEVDFTGRKILVADDDMRNVFAISALLHQLGMTVVAAADGKQALQKLAENPDVSIVLMDIMMPEMDGYEAITEIRRQDQYKNLPVIAITAKAMKEDKEKCIQAGASEYLTKPVDNDKLLTIIKMWLNK